MEWSLYFPRHNGTLLYFRLEWKSVCCCYACCDLYVMLWYSLKHIQLKINGMFYKTTLASSSLRSTYGWNLKENNITTIIALLYYVKVGRCFVTPTEIYNIAGHHHIRRYTVRIFVPSSNISSIFLSQITVAFLYVSLCFVSDILSQKSHFLPTVVI